MSRPEPHDPWCPAAGGKRESCACGYADRVTSSGRPPFGLLPRADLAGVYRDCAAVEGAEPAHPGLCLAVWTLLATYADRSGRNAWPMQRTLAEQLDVDVRAVRRAVRRLKRTGWLTVHKKHVKRANGQTLQRTITTYEVHYRTRI